MSTVHPCAALRQEPIRLGPARLWRQAACPRSAGRPAEVFGTSRLPVDIPGCRGFRANDRPLSGRTYPQLLLIVRVFCAVASASCWLLRLLSPLLSTRRTPSSGKPTRTLQGMARVRSGQAPAWPLVSGRSGRRHPVSSVASRVTFTRRFSPESLPCGHSHRMMLEGRTRTLSGPSPDLSQATTLAPCGRSEDPLIRSHPYGHPDPFRSVRDLGCFSARCSCTSEVPGDCSPGGPG